MLCCCAMIQLVTLKVRGWAVPDIAVSMQRTALQPSCLGRQGRRSPSLALPALCCAGPPPSSRQLPPSAVTPPSRLARSASHALHHSAPLQSALAAFGVTALLDGKREASLITVGNVFYTLALLSLPRTTMCFFGLAVSLGCRGAGHGRAGRGRTLAGLGSGQPQGFGAGLLAFQLDSLRWVTCLPACRLN